MKYLLAIDQGTTNSRAIIFDASGHLIASAAIALTQFFPHEGWVEQDPNEMVMNTIACCREVIKKARMSPLDIAAVGITNQRETTIVWDKKTGQPIYHAIVWQDRRTSDLCHDLAHAHDMIVKKTGLLLDPYFSATKIKWLLENVTGAKKRAEENELLFGTVDTFLLWKLTKEHHHVTDVTNAARTLLFNIHELEWDHDLLELFQIPKQMLPIVYDNTADFGHLDDSILGVGLPICAMVGDQQAATVGQACFETGMIKATYGTGCFTMLNTGKEIIQSQNRLLSTIAYRINGEVTYALEGSIFSAGVVIKWLRDMINLIQSASDSEVLARKVADTQGVYVVPAFTGLGAPYWDPYARGAIFGLTRSTTRAHIVRAALESIAYQTLDLLNAQNKDFKSGRIHSLRIDGGMVANQWLMQFIADILNIPLSQPTCIETTALGAAFLAGLHVGLYGSLGDIAKLWQEEKVYYPNMTNEKREELYTGWQEAVRRTLTD